MKRFTETNKWADPWFRKLAPKLKCLWMFMCDQCDSAGVIEMDYEVVSMLIGATIGVEDVVALGSRVEMLPCGKWWIVRFIPFQYGTLSLECKAHGPAFASLDSYGLHERVSKGYRKGLDTPKDKEKEKVDGVGVQGERKEHATKAAPKLGVLGEGVLLPSEIDTPELRQAWMEYTAYRRERKLARLTDSSVRRQFEEFKTWGVEAAIRALQTSIRKGWQGIFEPKPEPSTNGTQRHPAQNPRVTQTTNRPGRYAQVGQGVHGGKRPEVSDGVSPGGADPAGDAAGGGEVHG